MSHSKTETSMVRVEVVYLSPERTLQVCTHVPFSTSAREVVLTCGREAGFKDDFLQHAPLGIYGVRLKTPELHQVKEGDRVEIYRPLLVDPKERRRQQALKNKLK